MERWSGEMERWSAEMEIYEYKVAQKLLRKSKVAQCCYNRKKLLSSICSGLQETMGLY